VPTSRLATLLVHVSSGYLTAKPICKTYLDNSLDIPVTFGIVHSPQFGCTLAVLRVSSENTTRPLSLASDHASHRRFLKIVQIQPFAQMKALFPLFDINLLVLSTSICLSGQSLSEFKVTAINSQRITSGDIPLSDLAQQNH